jgi:hypothetical protein
MVACLHPNTRAQVSQNDFQGLMQPSQHYYRLFPAGDYLYNFEFVVDSSLPETIKTNLGSVKYNLEASIEPSGRFCSPLTGSLDIPIVWLPAKNSLESIEPITISRVWRDKPQFKFPILGKSFCLGSRIPINLKLMPTANLVCHWIKVYVTEHLQHWTKGKELAACNYAQRKRSCLKAKGP